MPELAHTICLLEEHFSNSSSSAKLKDLKTKVLRQRPARDPDIYVQVNPNYPDVFSSAVIAMQCDMTVLQYNMFQEFCSVYMADLERKCWAFPVMHEKDLHQVRKSVKAWVDLLNSFSGEALCSGGQTIQSGCG